MIRIIKHGDKRKETCPNCHCEFIFEDEDTFSDGPREEYTCVKCPDCGRIIHVN